jgi:hypothetical protein
MSETVESKQAVRRHIYNAVVKHRSEYEYNSCVFYAADKPMTVRELVEWLIYDTANPERLVRGDEVRELEIVREERLERVWRLAHLLESYRVFQPKLPDKYGRSDVFAVDTIALRLIVDHCL